jgi:hypothetical protein
MELQNNFEEPAGERCTHDNNSNGVLLVPQPDRPTMRHCLLYFVPRDSMFFPYFLFDEGFKYEFAEPQVNHILRATGQENNLWSRTKQIGVTISQPVLMWTNRGIK